jgi:hypothetical protein
MLDSLACFTGGAGTFGVGTAACRWSGGAFSVSDRLGAVGSASVRAADRPSFGASVVVSGLVTTDGWVAVSALTAAGSAG